MSEQTNTTAHHTHFKISELLQYGDNKLKSIVKHDDGTAHSARKELTRLQGAGHLYLVNGQCQHKNADGSCAGHVLPVEPVRDESGYYCHPAVPDFNEDPNAVANWVYEQQLTINTQLLFDEPADSEAFDNYFNCGGGAEKWQPVAPAGDGWFMLALFDTDDGPACWWARHNTDLKVLTLHRGTTIA